MMLLQEKIQNTKFSNSEQKIIEFILEKGIEIDHYSTTRIAKETYSSPSSLIRIAKKLDFDGWLELKKAYIEEVTYLQTYFQDIDPNYPFDFQDNIMSVANKISSLYIESAKDTSSLLQHDSLQKAVQLMNNSERILIFAIGNMNYLAEEFAFKLRRIHKTVMHDAAQDNQFHDALMATSKDIALCLSYSGETPTLLKTVKYLKKNHVPIIALTSLGDNSLAKLATVTLNVTTREKSFSKIAAYSSYQSFSLILDILYSCFFNLDYQKNLDYKLNIAKQVEKDRMISNAIIEEE